MSKSAATRLSRRRWDVILTVVLLFGLIAVAGVMSFFGSIITMGRPACNDPTTGCDLQQFDLGAEWAQYGPLAVALVGTVAAVVALVRGWLAFWIPVVAAFVSYVVWLAAMNIMEEAAPFLF